MLLLPDLCAVGRPGVRAEPHRLQRAEQPILKRVTHYCVYLPAGYDAAAQQKPPKRYPVLYFLHGLGDNEQTLFNSGGWTMLDDLRNHHQMGDFLIVAPEGRRGFYVNSADGSVRYNDFFLQEFMPAIESKYRIERSRAHAPSAESPWGAMARYTLPLLIPNCFQR